MSATTTPLLDTELYQETCLALEGHFGYTAESAEHLVRLHERRFAGRSWSALEFANAIDAATRSSVETPPDANGLTWRDREFLRFNR